MTRRSKRFLRVEPTTIIGLGNLQRGDDAVGLLVAEQLSERNLPNVKVLCSSGEATDLLDKIPCCGLLILVDAMAQVSRRGRIRRMDTSIRPLPVDVFAQYSTHGMGLSEAVEMARALGRLPPRVIVYGVEGRHFEVGSELSAELETSIKCLVQQITDELK